MCPRLALALALLLGFGLAASPTTEASPPVALEAPASTPWIASGEAAPTCAWPSAVVVSSGTMCSGTLIHPRVVVYAAHCGGGLETIRFGEDAFAGGRSVAVESCKTYPNYAGATDQGHDWAYCVLAEAVEDLPLAPPLYGCERERLAVGEEVALVGFGETLDGPSGVKHWAAATLVAVTPSKNTTLVGNPMVTGTPSICPGDSGGPALIQVEDGSWRTFGIASTVAGGCGGYGAHAMLAGAIPWIEEDSGVDVTPCHTIDGKWAPGPACAGASTQAPNVGAGTWASWCAGSPRAGPSTSCGPAWDEFDASALPSVAITSPSPGAGFLAGTEISVEIAATKHPEGFAIASVSLAIDGVIVAVDDNDPWRFVGPPFSGAGDHSLLAIAQDWAGNTVESEAVMITWGEGPELPDPSESESESETSGAEPAPADGEPGCAITAKDGGTPWSLALLACALLAWRRAW